MDDKDTNTYTFTYDDENITLSIAKMSDFTDPDSNTYPTYSTVLSAQEELRQKELRENHPDLKKAYEEYTTLLAKYDFWNKITK